MRDYAKVPLTAAEVGEIVRTVGVAAVLNTRHEIAKANGWGETPPPPDVFVPAALNQPNLLRRPILVRGDQFVVGKGETAIRALLQ